uniref:Uncharacterized protein n=1 Tax=Eutreptiella gymnastica TaxID=73025 RepID=A0A7S1NLT2_9EUGL
MQCTVLGGPTMQQPMTGKKPFTKAGSVVCAPWPLVTEIGFHLDLVLVTDFQCVGCMDQPQLLHSLVGLTTEGGAPPRVGRLEFLCGSPEERYDVQSALYQYWGAVSAEG